MDNAMGKEEIQRYLRSADDELQAAHDNLQLGHIRVAVSRAYYAMFYASTALLGSRGVWRSKHQGVIAAFGEHFVKPGLIEPAYGRMLNDAFHARLDTDYVPHVHLDADATRELVQKAQGFVRRIAQFLAEVASDRGGNNATG
jgi:uncharacterized protein (UPF0332 family)